MWNTLLRSMSGDKPDLGYFRTTAALGQRYDPSDMYQGTRLAAAEAINGGITFVHDWCHNIRSLDYAEQDLRALRESGLRARFSYGGSQGMANTQGIVLADLELIERDWPKYSNDGLITLGLAWRGMGGNNPATDSSQRTKISGALQFDAATDVQRVLGTHRINRADTPLACLKDRSGIS